MDEKLYDEIFRRKSFHLFRDVEDVPLFAEEIEDIYRAWDSFDPLYPDIRTRIRIVSADKTSCKRGEEYCALIYSENKDNYLMNVGYLGQQLDLYLVSKNIGTLWFGIGKSDEESYEGLDFVIMIAIRKVNDVTKFRKDMFKSKRKSLDEIWEGETVEGVSEIVRFTPSACNTQPWFVRKDGNRLSVYRYRKPGKRGIMPVDRVCFYNRIDLGIFICFMDLCLMKEGYGFSKELFIDDGEDKELTLNAIYTLDE